MAIFVDSQPVASKRRRLRGRIGWGLVIVAVAAIVVAALLPSGNLVEKPGPVYDTLGSVEVDGKEVPLIDVPASAKTYKTTGSLDMLTVSISGTNEKPVSWLDTALAWLTPSEAVVPVEAVYPQGTTVEQSNEQGAVEMQNSQQEAVAAALTDLGYDFSSILSVNTVQAGSPADGKLEVGDVVTSVNGQKFTDVSALRAIIAANGTDAAASVDITRKGAPMTFTMTPVLSDGDTPAPILGVALQSAYDFPIDITIQLQNVGGPSAGQMFALGIIDKLTPGSLTGGARVAGTGTITGSGEIGAIGGIRQKLYGAKAAGATYFLAPESNCNEVTGHIPSGLTVVAVSTLDDSVAALKVIAAKGDTAKLAACPAG